MPRQVGVSRLLWLYLSCGWWGERDGVGDQGGGEVSEGEWGVYQVWAADGQIAQRFCSD